MSHLEQHPRIPDVSSSVTPTEAEAFPPPPTSPTVPYLHLSVTRTWGNRSLPVASAEWLALRDKILTRDNRTCASCAYTSPHPKGRGLQIDHRNGDASDNDHTNLRVHCPPCEAIRHCGLSGIKGWVCLASSDMEQVEIVRRTRKMFEESGKIPRIREVDPLANHAEINTIDLANKLMKMNREDLTEEEKGLRGFFTQKASDRFAITMATGYVSRAPPLDIDLTVRFISQSGSPTQFQPSNPLDAPAVNTPTVERAPSLIYFSPELYSTLQNFLTTWPPSSTLQPQVAWICVGNAHLQPVDDKGPTDMSGLCEAWGDICTDHEPVTTDLDNLARRFDVLKGKWLVFSRPGQIDFLWSRIAKETYRGKLGISSKVSPRDDSGSHVICIHTRDYTDETDVERVRNGLRQLGVRWKIGYKPDVYTYCRVYRDNPWHIKPTRYHD